MSDLPPDVATHLPLAPRDYLILFCLQGGPRHGYGIIREVESQSDGLVAMDPSNLYRSIKRLMRDGLVEEREPTEPESDGAQRRYHGLTPLGQRVMRAEAERLSALTRAAESRQVLSGETGR